MATRNKIPTYPPVSIRNQRYAGQLKNFVDDLLTDAQVVKEQYIVSRQVPRIKEVWLDNTTQLGAAVTEPVFIDGSLYEGWHLKDGTSAEVIVYSDTEIFGWEKPTSGGNRSRSGKCPRTSMPTCRWAIVSSTWIMASAIHRTGEPAGRHPREFLAWITTAATSFTSPSPRRTG